jgi:hypothetical protein
VRLAVSLDASEVECPHCGSLPLFPCRTPKGRNITGYHGLRAANAERIAHRVAADVELRERQARRGSKP